MADLDFETRMRLAQQGVEPEGIRQRTTKDLPPNALGIPQLMMYDVPYLTKTGTRGFIMDKQSPGEKDRIYLDPKTGKQTVSHEAEHLLAERGLGHAEKINQKFDELIGNKKLRNDFVNAAIEAGPYLEEKYGLNNAYFTSKMRSFQGSLAPNLLFEQLASLASVEQTQGVDLTKDPILRKTLFKDPSVRETYNALTGLRQTRTDPRDLPPYTRVPEKEEGGESVVHKLKKLIGFAEGGMVPNAGNTKLI